MDVIFKVISAESYSMNGYALSVTGVSLLILWLGLNIYHDNPHDIKNKAFFYAYMSIFFWLFFFGVSVFAIDPDVVIFWFKYPQFLGTAYISTAIYWFTLSWSTQLYEKQKKTLHVFFGLFTVWLLLGWFTDLVFLPEVTLYSFGYAVDYATWGFAFIVLWFVPFGLAMRNLYFLKKTSTDPFFTRSIKTLIVGFWIMFCAASDYLGGIFPNLDLYPAGYIFIFVSIVFMSFSIARYHFMDVQTTVHKLLVWVITTAAIGLPFSIIFALLLVCFSGAHMITAVVFVVAGFYMFGWAKNVLQPKIDHVLRIDKRGYKAQAVSVNEKIFASTSLKDLASHVLDGVYSLYAPVVMHYYVFNENACVFTATMEKGEVVQADHVTQKDLSSAFEMFLNNDKLQKALEEKTVLYRQEYIRSEGKEGGKEILDLFGGGNIDVIILVKHEDTILSFISLGKKQGGGLYSREELNVLEGVERSASVTTKSLLSFENVLAKEKVLKASLEKKVIERSRELVEKNRELEDFQDKTANRELKMIELKKRLDELERVAEQKGV